MKVVADLHLHSKYSRAVSPNMTLSNIAKWADKKGIDLVGTGDFTHPSWFTELKSNLEESEAGIYKLKVSKFKSRFLLTTEISCIYKHMDKGRRVHLVIFLSSIKNIAQFNKKLTNMGANLMSDGRPIVGLSLAQVTETVLDIDPSAIIIPAHVWTPWFGLYGNMSGFDHLKEAFGDLEKHIHAIETGLSSDPAMNWKIAELANRSIVSFGDAHSPQKLGREATVFEMSRLTYENVRNVLYSTSHPTSRISHTIEFYPEEGKYHYTGHKKCNVIYSPKKAKKRGLACPVCGRKLTLGVMGRVEQLASVDIETESSTDKFGVRWICDKRKIHPKYVMLVPLAEIISETLGIGVNTKGVEKVYEQFLETYGNEFEVLLCSSLEDIAKIDPKVSRAIGKVRSGDITIRPGYDGVFGEVDIWGEGEKAFSVSSDQKVLF